MLEFDFPGLEIGVADYDEGPTVCTVFHFPAGGSASIDVRGGPTSPPSRNDLARLLPSTKTILDRVLDRLDDAPTQLGHRL